MTKYLTPEDLIDELNLVVDQHNALAADFLHCLARLSWHLAIRRRKLEQFDELLAESNRLLALAQRAQALQEENEHLWQVLAELDTRLCQYEENGCKPDENA